jgi:3-(3-hydroxy-phenyl)propionate hydroxylase
VAQSALIDMRWQTSATAMAQNDDGATLTLQDPTGSYELRCDWHLAADGARSAMRTALGLRLKGDNFEGRYVIADIKMHNPVPVERFSLFDPDRRPGSTVLVHQQPDDIWRIDYQLRAGETEEDALQEDNIRTSVQQVLDECGYAAPWDLEWWSVYSANTLLLDDYRHGRTLFVGDAAHIVPIFGVRGFNNGVLDAVKGWADEALLDTYSFERRRATLDVFDKAAKSAQFMTPRSRGFVIMRDAALSLALDHAFAGQFANPRNMTPYDYDDSPLTRSDTCKCGPPVGSAAPNAKLAHGFLLDLLAQDYSVLTFGKVADLEACDDLPVQIVPFPANGPAADIYDAKDGTAYLIRPDGFIAARWHDATGAQIASELTTQLSGGRKTP